MNDKFSPPWKTLVYPASASVVKVVTATEDSSLPVERRVHSGNVAYDKASKTLTFAPSTPFAANTKYTVNIGGQKTASPVVCDDGFFFTTGAAREIELHVEVRGQAQTRGSFRLSLAGGALDALKAAAVAAVTPPAALTAVKAFSAFVIGVTIPLQGDADVIELQDGDLIVIDI